ncbi:MAG: hypothetical protein HZB38_11595 [Planctomycetes bacterium]|nr:hypothetical protein [Planctomycetota bacterium]
MAADAPKAVKKYEVVASFRDGVVHWRFGLLTEDNEKHYWDVRDGEEIPILMELCRRDWTIFYDPQTRELSSGWNLPGSKESSTFH